MLVWCELRDSISSFNIRCRSVKNVSKLKIVNLTEKEMMWQKNYMESSFKKCCDVSHRRKLIPVLSLKVAQKCTVLFYWILELTFTSICEAWSIGTKEKWTYIVTLIILKKTRITICNWWQLNRISGKQLTRLTHHHVAVIRIL